VRSFHGCIAVGFARDVELEWQDRVAVFFDEIFQRAEVWCRCCDIVTAVACGDGPLASEAA